MYGLAVHRPENMVTFKPPTPPTLWLRFKWWFEDRVFPWLLLTSAWLNIYVSLMVLMRG